MLRYALRRAPPLDLPDNFHARPPSKTQLWHSPDTLAETTRGKGRGGNDALPRGFFFCKFLLVRQRFGNARPRRRCCTRTCLNPKAMLTGYALNYALKKKHIKGPLSAAAACGQRRGHVKGLWPRATLTAWRKSDSCSIPTASMPMHAEITCFATASPSAVRSEH